MKNIKNLPYLWPSTIGGLQHILFITLLLGSVTSAIAETNAWSSAGNMTIARVEHTAILLLNGKVLVTGGGGFGSPIASAELYDPTTNTWSSAGKMSIARASYTVTQLQNGKVLFTGGGVLEKTSASGGQVIPLASAELYDPVTNSWSSTGSLTTERLYHTATLLPNGKVLVAGGDSFSRSAFSIRAPNSAELYDPITNTWSNAGNWETSQIHHTAILLPSDKVLIAGGMFGSAELYDPATNTWKNLSGLTNIRSRATVTLLQNGKVLVASKDSAELYDPDTNSWSSTGSMVSTHTYCYGSQPCSDNMRATPLSTGKVLVVGNWDVNAELYDPATNTWSSGGSMATARQDYIVTPLQNGKVLITGGWYESSSGSSLATSAELYDPATNSWSSAGNMEIGRLKHTATPLQPQNGGVLITGGYGNGDIPGFPGSAQNSAEIFNPITSDDSWAKMTNIPIQGIKNLLYFSVAGKGYIGITNDIPLSAHFREFWEYNPTSNTWSRKADLPAGFSFQAPSFVIGNKAYIVIGNQTWKYDPSSDIWTKMSDVPGAHKRAAFGMSINEQGYIGGGFYNGQSFWRYNPSRNEWSQLKDHPVLSYAGSDTDPGGITFTIGGKGYVTGTNMNFWEYDPKSDKWTQKAYVDAGHGAAFSIFETGYVFGS